MGDRVSCRDILRPALPPLPLSPLLDDFPESVGVQRISEALQAHVWPDLEMKSTVTGERSAVKTVSHEVNTDARQEENQPPEAERKTAPSKEPDPSASAPTLMATEDSTRKRIG